MTPRLLASIVFIVFAIVGSGLATLVWRSGYSIAEMDWDGDGATSVSEMLKSVDIGSRLVVKGGVECIEYFQFKDGVALRVLCP